MIEITNPRNCSGCTSCASVCAREAITMQPDALGFLYPKVDVSKCVDCGLCDKVCAFNDQYDRSLNLEAPVTYGARHKDMAEVATSRSGAAFIALSDRVLDQGGVVYGVGFKDHFRVAHKRAETREERDEFKGSKYVQSDLTGIFGKVKQDLKDGKKVMFVGTPCQTAGLNSYIGKNLRQGLYLVDIACHGAPGPFLWRDYIAYIEAKKGDRIAKLNFRDKQKYGWKAHHESFVFEKRAQKVTFPFTFYKELFFRQSCFNCKFTNLQRPSDLTLADFWHSENIDQNLHTDNNGMSLLFVNTEKGKALIAEVKDKFATLVEVDVHKAMQKAFRRPLTPLPQREKFEADYKTRGFEYVFKKYCLPSTWERIVKKVKRLFKK